MSSTATSAARGELSPASAFTAVINAAVGVAAGKLEEKVVGWADKLSGVAAAADASRGVTGLADQALDRLGDSGGATQKAGAEGIKAHLHGRNPFWAAIKGAWQAGTPVVRAAIVAGLASSILLLVLSPVPLLVFLLSLLILAAVQRVRAAQR